MGWDARRDAWSAGGRMEGTQKGMDGGMPREVCVERGSGPAAVPLPGAVCPPPQSFVGAGDTQRCSPPSSPGCAAQRHGQGLTRSSLVQGMGLGGTQPVPRWHGGVRAREGGSRDLRCGRTERESSISSSGWAERKKTYLQQKAGLRNSAALLGQRKLSLK